MSRKKNRRRVNTVPRPRGSKRKIGEHVYEIRDDGSYFRITLKKNEKWVNGKKVKVKK